MSCGLRRTVHQRLAGADPLAFLHVDVDAARQRVFARLGARLVGDDDDLALTLDDAAVLDDAVDFRDDRRLARLARFEQFDHARQTAGDVLGLGRLARNLREHVARRHHLAVLHHQVRVDGMWYLRLTLPSLPLISIAGCFFSSGESTMMSATGR